MTEDRSSQLTDLLALVGIGLVLVLVPLLSPATRIKIGPVPLESLTFTVPLAIVLAIPLFRRLGSEGMPRIGFELAAVAFLVLAAVSIPFSDAPRSALGTWVRYAGYVALVPAVAAVARKEANRRVLLWLLVGAGTVTVFIGILQYLNPTTIKAIGMQGLDDSVATRIYSTFANPNFYAEYLVLLIAATLSLAVVEDGWTRGLALGLGVAEVIALGLTFTRGSWIALAFGLVVAVMMIDVRYLWGLMGAGLVGALAVPGVRHRVLSIFSLEGTASFRLRLWRLTGAIIGQHPLTGVGIGQFVPAFKMVSIQHPELETDFLIYGAHNSYFTLMAETGILGGMAFAFMVLSAVRTGVFYGVRMTADPKARLQNAALTVGIVAFGFNALTSNSFQHPQAAVFFFVLAGLQAGLGSAFWTEPLPATRKALTLPPERTGLVGGSWAARAAIVTGRGLQDLWASSSLHHWLISAPLGDGSVYRRSLVVRALVGKREPAVQAETENA